MDSQVFFIFSVIVSGLFGVVIGLLYMRNQMTIKVAEKEMEIVSLTERLNRVSMMESKLNEMYGLHDEKRREVSGLREEISRLTATLKAELERNADLLTDLRTHQANLKQERELRAMSETQLADLRARQEIEAGEAKERLRLLLEAKETLSNQFKTLASDIFEEKSKRFTEQNQLNISQILAPLKARIYEFQEKVEACYVQEGKDRTSLAEQVRQLMELNQTLSREAKNLTKALKGSAKTQGNWGEFVLERILDASGLRKGEEYIVQASFATDTGGRVQPDVVINLPENRHMVIDSKVSLNAYEDFVTAEADNDRQDALKRHLISMRGHINNLSSKNYQNIYSLNALDFVLMFIPIEPAFMLAVTNDRELFMDAWQKNVLLVSPSTLLFVVRTVAHLWRQEAQNRNAQEIAKRGAELYDRLVGFVTDLEKVGERLRQAQSSYDEACGKLYERKGNVIRQAEMLKELGVKPVKTLPATLTEKAMEGS